MLDTWCGDTAQLDVRAVGPGNSHICKYSCANNGISHRNVKANCAYNLHDERDMNLMNKMKTGQYFSSNPNQMAVRRDRGIALVTALVIPRFWFATKNRRKHKRERTCFSGGTKCPRVRRVVAGEWYARYKPSFHWWTMRQFAIDCRDDAICNVCVLWCVSDPK